MMVSRNIILVYYLILAFPLMPVQANGFSDSLSSIWKGVTNFLGFHKTSHVEDPQKYECGPRGYTWHCCERLSLPAIDLDETACLEMSYLPKALGFSVNIKWNGFTIIKESVSVRNPPPLCVGIPEMDWLDVCLVFHNVTFSEDALSSCVAFRLDLGFHKDFEISCFSLPLGSENRGGSHIFRRSLKPPHHKLGN
ncbi:uncharacterized protein LOC115218648 [Argonauta hians]